MKKEKLKRILLTLCSLALVLSCCFGLCGCDIGEVKEATTAGVEASTSVLPVEYSQNLSKTMFASAMSNSLNQCGYKIKFNCVYYKNEVITSKTNNVVTCKKDENNVLSYLFEITDLYYYVSLPDSSLAGHSYYWVNKSTNYAHKSDALDDTTGINLMTLAGWKADVSNVLVGKYYQGKTHIYVSKTVDNTNLYVDFVIENDLITSINMTGNGTGTSEGIYSILNLEIEYGEQTITNLPTSLDGYTVS